MKGFYIFEESLNQLRKEATVACFKLGDISHIFNTKLEPNAMASAEVEITASVGNTITKATTNEDDFETGALISLMKMCGLEKVVRAFNEVFLKETYNTYITKYERELHKCLEENKNFKEKSAELLGENGRLKYIKSCNESTIESLEKTRDLLKAENEKLKSDKDKTWKIYQRNIQKKQDRINELNNIEEEYIKLREDYDSLFEEKEKLQHDYNLCLNSENALKYTVDSLNKSVAKLSKAIDGYKNDLYKVAKHSKELEEENEKLKLDCEKLQHGYNDMIICGGRQNGKQFTFLVDLFKKLDQKKVDAAYKEAYGKRLIWCSSQSSTRDMLDSLIESCKYAILTDKDGEKIEKWTGLSEFTWELKEPTKREKMWEDIKNGKIGSIKVEKAFINDFLSEAEDNGLVWANGGEKPTEWDKWESWRRHDYIVFSLFSVVNPKELTWNTTLKENTINYLPPMRWDLFEKGCLAVKVNYNNYKEFYDACEKELGKRPVTAFMDDFTVSICKKDGCFKIFTVEDQKKTGRKIVNWEDVR